MASAKLCVTGLSALLISGCAQLAPYPTRYQTGDIDAPPSGASCADHTVKAQVLGCLQKRAQGWEATAARIRGQGYLAGTLAIPAAATAIGLSAEHDPNHAVGPLGLVTGALITHTASYARADQATIAETAAAAYACLIKQAGDWQGAPYNTLVQDYTTLGDDLKILNEDVSVRKARIQPKTTLPKTPSVMTAGGVVTAQKAIDEIAKALTAGDGDLGGVVASPLDGPGIAYIQAGDVTASARVHEDAVGSDLVGQAVLIDSQATKAMGGAQPDAMAVAGAANGGLTSYMNRFNPPPAPATPAAKPPAAGAGSADKAGTDNAKAEVDTAGKKAADAAKLIAKGLPAGAKIAGAEAPVTPPAPPTPPGPTAEETAYINALGAAVAAAHQYEKDAHDLLTAFQAHVTDFTNAQTTFQHDASAYKPTSSAGSCTFTFNGIAAFTSDPVGPITTANNVARFTIRGGLRPYRPVVSSDLKISTTDAGTNAMSVEVTVPSDATAKGPWDVVVYEGSSASASVTVRIQKPSS